MKSLITEYSRRSSLLTAEFRRHFTLNSHFPMTAEEENQLAKVASRRLCELRRCKASF